MATIAFGTMPRADTEARQRKKIKFAICPCCGRKGYYKVWCNYEKCRYCGFYRLLLPGQDF